MPRYNTQMTRYKLISTQHRKEKFRSINPHLPRAGSLAYRPQTGNIGGSDPLYSTSYTKKSADPHGRQTGYICGRANRPINDCFFNSSSGLRCAKNLNSSSTHHNSCIKHDPLSGEKEQTAKEIDSISVKRALFSLFPLLQKL